jgi:tetratricopeptide (TPR) repeat protein
LLDSSRGFFPVAAMLAFLAVAALVTAFPMPAHSELMPELSEALDAHKAGKLREAVEIYTEALAKKPNSPEAHNWRGMALDDLGDPDKAIEDFNKAIEVSPNYADAYNNRGEAYRKKKMYPQAMADYRKAAQLDAKFAEAFYNMGLIHEAQQRKAQAAQEYSNYLKLKADDPEKDLIAEKVKKLHAEGGQVPAPGAAPGAPAPGAPPAAGPLPPGFTPPGGKPGMPGAPPFAMPGMPKKQPGYDLGVPGVPPIPGDLGLLMGTMGIFSAILPLVFYVFFGLMLFFIAKKTNTPLPWLGFIPIANIVLMVQIARKPIWWLAVILLMFVAPFAMILAAVDPTGGIIATILTVVLMLVGFAAWVMVNFGIAQARGKSIVWGILLCIPCTSWIALGYLGLSK